MMRFNARAWVAPVLIAAIGFMAAPVVMAQDAPTALPDSAFQGCETVTLAPSGSGPDPVAVRSGAPGGPVEVQTTKKTRILQGLPVDQAAEQTETNQACWARLDGVWQDDTVIALDPRVKPEGWAADLPSLQSLSHGTYTEPELLIVLPGDRMEQEINVVDAFDPEKRATFTSTDAIPLGDVLKRGGKRKRYTAPADTGFGTDLLVDVSRSGFVRLRMGDRLFSRPSPGIISQVNANDYGLSDVFVYQSNLDNVMASRRGYDITSQHPFDLLNNDKLEVFKEVFGNQYRILEKRTVPLGFTLVPEVKQGMVYQREFSTTEKEIQTAVKAAFGGKARVGLAPGGVKLGPSASAGADFTAEMAKTMRTSQSASRATGYSRTKLYAIVVDHPYIELSDEFIDAIEDARRYGDDEPEIYQRIIDKFGTHYPYAVTYGANAEMAFTYSEKATYERLDLAASARVEGELEMVQGAVSGYASAAIERGEANSSSSGDEHATFQAVGGNGSWDQNGFAAGDRPAPILLDLRPLDELLNPLNFPGEPEVYETVRAKLHQKIKDYSDLRSAGISDWPIYDTRLNGAWYTDTFPDLVFEFTASSYVKSAIQVRAVDGRKWFDYVRDLRNEGGYAPHPEIVRDIQNRGLRYEDIYTKEGATGSVEFFLLDRIDGGSYRAKRAGQIWKEKAPVVERGIVDADYFDYVTLLNNFSVNADWLLHAGETAEEDTLQVTNYGPANAEVEPVVLRRWTLPDIERARASRLSGSYRTNVWPDIVFTVLDDDQYYLEAAITDMAGDPVIAGCLEQLTTPVTAKSRMEQERYSRIRLVQPNPMVAEYRPSIWAMAFLAMVDTSLENMAKRETLKPEEETRVTSLQCLRDPSTPFGTASDTFPIITRNPDGSLSGRWVKTDVDAKAGPKIMDLSSDAWEPVGQPFTLTRLSDAVSEKLEAKIRKRKQDLIQAAEAAESGDKDTT